MISHLPDLLFTTQTAPFRSKHPEKPPIIPPSLSFQHKSRKNIKDSAAIYHIRPEMHEKDPSLESQLFPRVVAPKTKCLNKYVIKIKKT